MKMLGIEKWFMNRPQHAKRTIDRADKLLPLAEPRENQKFLEVGCGSGAVSRHVAVKYHLNVTGTDLDEDQVQRAQVSTGDLPNLHFLEADGAQLPFQDNDFDVVLSFGVMHHIPNWLDALEEINRVLKPGGYFIYFDVFYPRWLTWIAKLFRHRYGVTTIPALHSFVEKSSLSIISSKFSRGLFLHRYEAVYQKL